MQTTVGTEAAPLTGGTVSVYYDQARGETTLVGRLLGDAKRQIVMEIQNHVRDGRGVILIDWPQAKHVMAAATKRLGLGEFRHVQTVIGCGQTVEMLCNPNGQPFPTEVARQMVSLIGW